MTHTFAIDTETYYDKDCSISSGLDVYVNHPKFDCYMLTVVGTDGTNYAGRPEDFDWSKLEGQVWLSHNRSFDKGIIDYLMRSGKVPWTFSKEWHCTSDLVAFLGYPRSLKGASKEVLGIEVSKDTRDAMKGKRWETMDEDFRKEVLSYATKDSELCLDLWQKLEHRWPENERRASRDTTDMCHYGLYVDQDTLDRNIETLGSLLFEIEDTIPWAEEASRLSTIELGKFCRKNDVDPPPSTDKKDAGYIAWKARNPEMAKVTEAMGDYRSANALLKKLKEMRSRVRPDDGRMGYGLKYCGAHTGRDSGDSGWNVQNMTKGEMFGVNLRNLVTAAPGHKLVIADLSQIEPRCLAWLSGDTRMLEVARVVDDWYEVQARAWKLWTEEGSLKKNGPEVRDLVKALNIGLGYGMSAGKFAMMTNLPLQRCETLTNMYRAANPKVTNLWRRLHTGMLNSARTGDTFVLQLPSGRELTYHRCSSANGLSAVITKGGQRVRLKFWHGVLVENLVQAVARDVFFDRVNAISDAGYRVVLRVHDEVVCEVPEEEADDAAADIKRLMTTPPSWMATLPLGASCDIATKYTK